MASGPKAKINQAPQQSKPTERPKSSDRQSLNVAISCSPDTIKNMENLRNSLNAAGHSTKVVNYTDSSVGKLKCKAVIIALSTRFIRSNMAVNEVKDIRKVHSNVIPLILDVGIKYPPDGSLRGTLDGVRSINCAKMHSGISWDNTGELAQILAQIQGFGIAPDGGISKEVFKAETMRQSRPPRERSVYKPSNPSNPSAVLEPDDQQVIERHHHSDSEPLPKRPPLQRARSYADEGYDSAENDAKVAKDMKNGYKLPQLHAKKALNGQNPQQNPPRQNPYQNHQNAQNPHNLSRPSAQRRPNSVHRYSGSRIPKRTSFDGDGPKLPSIYRQRFRNT